VHPLAIGHPLSAPTEAPTTMSGGASSAMLLYAPAWYAPNIPPADNTSAVFCILLIRLWNGPLRFDILKKVDFRAADYGPAIARLLEPASAGTRLMPLVQSAEASKEACDQPASASADPATQAGLYLYLGCWDAAHNTADSVANPDGYFWHAIVHRQEPDPGNAAYWFHKTGRHPIFPKLAAEAETAGYPAARPWDPLAFIDYCEGARHHPGSAEERLAMQIQLLEWQLLFDHCARGRHC
jgi:hypothetical protein